ncbi:hypothetical protein R9C00_12720 [Flammeovirgaceae bacterium SG7u.111]|nr:hypothetical protein [Flammeovirgaceae bacterium SG7u.132]WPO38317.1 hypothetical protein R9C00_12720 [Flammeovirgaceae bacterium SG7u.111]
MTFTKQLITLTSFLLFCNLVFAQEQDSIIIRNDTTYIIKKPVIIKKQIYVKPQATPAKETPKLLRYSITPYVEIAYAFDYVKAHSDFRIYYDEIDAATSQKTSYGLGTILTLHRNNYRYSVDLGFHSFHEKFNTSELNSNNQLNTLSASLAVGYVMSISKKMDLTLMLEAGYMYAFQIEGYTYDHTEGTTLTFQEHGTFDTHGVMGKSKILVSYPVSTKNKLVFGPTYSVNLLSITQKHIPYDLWRNNLGVMVGIMFGIE